MKEAAGGPDAGDGGKADKPPSKGVSWANAVAALLSAFVLAGTFILTSGQNRAAENATRVVEAGDRLKTGVDALASRDVYARIGGIYSLASAMGYSRDFQGRIVEILAAFVRRQAKTDVKGECYQDHDHPDDDVQAALSVVARRDVGHDPTGVVTDLSHVCMLGANLRDAHLQGATIVASVLDCADLEGADFSRANLTDTNFEKVLQKGVRLPEIDAKHQAQLDLGPATHGKCPPGVGSDSLVCRRQHTAVAALFVGARPGRSGVPVQPMA